LVGINAFIVIRRGIEVEDREGDAPDH
jgi:hypothetical protein